MKRRIFTEALDSFGEAPAVKKKITIELDEIPYRLLQVLTCGRYAPQSVEEVIGRLVDHAQQGVYRPGAWERSWLCQAFGDDWTAYLEPGDPYGRSDCEHIFPAAQETVILTAEGCVMPRYYPEEEIERIKREVSLQRLVEASGIELKRHGEHWRGLCPFHNDMNHRSSSHQRRTSGIAWEPAIRAANKR